MYYFCNMGFRDFLTGLFSTNVPGNLELINAVGEHVEKWIGPIHQVLHEKRSGTVHVDVYWVKPTADRPFNVLITSGMSSIAMQTPPGAEECTHCELVMFLPPSWDLAQPYSAEALWPVTTLQAACRYPHQQGTWLWERHTIAIGIPQALPFTAVWMQRPFLLNPEMGELELADGRVIDFFALIGLLPGEHEYIIQNEGKNLLNIAEDSGRLDEFLVADPKRQPLI